MKYVHRTGVGIKRDDPRRTDRTTRMKIFSTYKVPDLTRYSNHTDVLNGTTWVPEAVYFAPPEVK